jgi:hypothetical protein
VAESLDVEEPSAGVEANLPQSGEVWVEVVRSRMVETSGIARAGEPECPWREEAIPVASTDIPNPASAPDFAAP